MWGAAGFEDVAEDVLTVRFQYEDFSDFWNLFENGDGPIRQFIGAFSQTERDTLKQKLEIAFLSGAEDGRRSFLAGALACRGTVPTL